MVIKYFADVRQLTRCEQEQWTKAAPTVRELLAGLETPLEPDASVAIFPMVAGG